MISSASFFTELSLCLSAVVIAASGAGYAQLCDSPLFPISVYETGTSPIKVVLGDIDGDGDQDVLVAAKEYEQTGEIWIYERINEHTINHKATILDIGGLRDLVVFDIENDGDLDLLYCSDSRMRVHVRLNDGMGNFVDPHDIYRIDQPAYNLYTEDLNNDGYTDFVVRASSAVGLLPFINDGTGKFIEGANHRGSASGPGTQLVDVDTDGDIDIRTYYGVPAYVKTYLNNGAGVFDETMHFSLDQVDESYQLHPGIDFDFDGDPDTIVAFRDSNIIQFYKNDGTGALKLALELDNPVKGHYFSTFSSTTDGHIELLFVNNGVFPVDDSTAAILRIEEHAAPEFGNIFPHIRGDLMDFDLDGDADLVGWRGYSQNALYFIERTLPDSLETFTQVPSEINPMGIQIGDMDGDGADDIVAVYEPDSPEHPDQISVHITFLNSWGEVRETHQQWVHHRSLYGLRNTIDIGDLDNDGDLDLIISNGNDYYSDVASVLLNNGDGSFQTPYSLQFENHSAEFNLLGDIDNDGDLDLVYGYRRSTIEPDVRLLFNNGDASFEPLTAGHGAAFSNVAPLLADLDNDGDLDFAGSERHGNRLFINLNDGIGGFPPFDHFEVGDDARYIASGFLNSDQSLDIVTANTDSLDLSILINNGDATFETEQRIPLSFKPYSVDIKDFDGDGLNDIVVLHLLDNQVTVLRNTGDAQFQCTQNYYIGQDPPQIALADLNNDGGIDIVTQNGGRNNYVWITFNQHPSQWCQADINRNGFVDIADVFSFLDYFYRGHARADLQANRTFDYFDVSAFLAAFAAGCP